MDLERELKLFCDSYAPVVELVNSKGDIEEEELSNLSENLHLAQGWQTVSVKQLWEMFDEADRLRDEDRVGEYRDETLNMLAKRDERVRWMDEIKGAQRLTQIGKPHPKMEHAIRYVSFNHRGYDLKFVPGYVSTKGHLFFDPPIKRKWEEKGPLVHSYLDSTKFGLLYGLFEGKDGVFMSTGLLAKREEVKDTLKIYRTNTEPVIQLKLGRVYDHHTKPAIERISFDQERLGEGELNSFFQHIGTNT